MVINKKKGSFQAVCDNIGVCERLVKIMYSKCTFQFGDNNYKKYVLNRFKVCSVYKLN